MVQTHHQGGSLQPLQQLLTWAFPHFLTHLPRELNKASDFLLHQKVHQGEWQLHTDRLRRYGVSITKQNQNFWSQRPQPTVSLYFSEAQHRITPEESLHFPCKAGHQAGCSSSWGCGRWTAKTISSNKSSWSLYQCNGRHLPNGPAF